MTTARKPPLAFVDEYGQANLDVSLPDIGTHFILAAVLVEEHEIDAARAALDTVRASHFQTGELRSKRLGKNTSRFRSVLEDLAAVPFKFCAIVVDKRAIWTDSGLAYKRSFQKFMAGLLYRKLFGAFPNLQVTADAFGREAFMEDFARYVLENHRDTLFDRPKITFVESHTEPLVQLADIVCGALARTYDQTKTTEKAAELLEVIRAKHALFIDEWPPRFRPASSTGALHPRDPDDDAIARYTVGRAEAFLERHERDTTDEVRAQVIVLKKLLYEMRFGDPLAWVPTFDLRESIERFDEARSEQWLRSSVIAPLRDAGILLASSSRGYKLPISVADVRAFVDFADTVALPLLHRVASARDAVRLITNGRVDLLASDNLAPLRGAVDAIADGEHKL